MIQRYPWRAGHSHYRRQSAATETARIGLRIRKREEMAVELLSKALDDMTMDRDAALVAKEDLNAQLRVAKRRLQEAEDEQYKAEEDAATLRAEIQSMLQVEERRNQNRSFADQEDMASMKSELEETWQKLQQEQLKLVAEQKRTSMLTSELKELDRAKQDTENALIALQNRHSTDTESASVTLPFTAASSMDDTGTSRLKSGNDSQLKELASMVERLETGRQKLLGEIDGQSLEIERLFTENANLTSSFQETAEAASRWERQVQLCLEQDAILRSEINELRMRQATMPAPEPLSSSEASSERGYHAAPGSERGVSLEALRNENSKLKVELATTQGREMDKASQIAQLSSELNRCILSANALSRTYGPVLTNIENRLLQLKQNGTMVDASFPLAIGRRG